jgi:glutathionylspermidine synthase
MASPEHVHWEGGHATLRTGTGATPLAAMVRFFPAEWLPIMGSSKRWARYFCDGQTPISNPGTAILLQSKRFPLAWPHLRTGLAAFRRLMPPACDPREVKRSERDVYVLKPVFGRVGEDIFMAGITPAEAWEKAWRVARRRPLEWVAQRRFGALPISDGGGKLYPTIGVYTVDGCAAGAYARIAGRPLVDHEAQDVAMLIENEVRR